MNETERTYRFPSSRRLHGRRMFAAVFGAKMRKHAGPLTVFVQPNGLGHPRLGLSITRRVGNAVKRNRIKRLLREAFRLGQHELVGGYDIVVTVRPHDLLARDEYQRLLQNAVAEAHGQWQRRENRRP